MGSRHSVAFSSTTRQPPTSRSSRVCPMGTCLYVSATGTCRSKATRRRTSSIASASSYANSRNPGPSWRWTSSAASTTTAAKSSSFLSGSGCLALLASWRFMFSYRPRGLWVAQIRSDTVVLTRRAPAGQRVPARRAALGAALGGLGARRLGRGQVRRQRADAREAEHLHQRQVAAERGAQAHVGLHHEQR